jgi:hypothetical protein
MPFLRTFAHFPISESGGITTGNSYPTNGGFATEATLVRVASLESLSNSTRLDMR